jgi:hypothetical protein
MNSDTLESSWHAVKRHMNALWSTDDHTAPYGLNTPTVYVSAQKLAVHELLRPASAFARVKARIVTATKSGTSKKDVKQQKEALNTWEDEGGTTAAGKPKNNDTVKH